MSGPLCIPVAGRPFRANRGRVEARENRPGGCGHGLKNCDF